MNEHVGFRIGELIRLCRQIGSLCQMGLAVSIRGGSGGGPQDTARPALVSELVVGVKPRAMASGASLRLLSELDP